MAIKGKKDQLSKVELEVTDIQTESFLTLIFKLHIFQRTVQSCSVTADPEENMVTEGWQSAWGAREQAVCTLDLERRQKPRLSVMRPGE